MKQRLHIIGFTNVAAGKDTFYSYNPAQQRNNDYYFHKATIEEINLSAVKASEAFQQYRKKTGIEKASFLEAIAAEITGIGEELITVTADETGLPSPRIEGEKMRTVNQLKMFAALLKEGSWVDARIDTAIPDRTPVPKPDLRFMHIPLGPVVVFGASNFPLAFSVAGGDTVSALAAGCPVIVKAHPAHPATSLMIGKAIQAAAVKTNMPDGIFSLLFDDGIDVGVQLVKHPLIKAVGFTGSFKGGKALYDIAAARPEPIPVYAEMGSTNPVFVLPEALSTRGREIAEGYSSAVTLGIGQFCTNPGLLIYQNAGDGFTQTLKAAFEKTTGGVMLTPGILTTFNRSVDEHLAIPGVTTLLRSGEKAANADQMAFPILLTAGYDTIKTNPLLSEEIFGPAGTVIPVQTKDDMMALAENLTGHLTATVHGTDNELIQYRDLLDILEQKAGRLIINGFPTGVEVCSSMVHGGPFPSTTDSKTTSVGTAAIYRFTRPVCYQNMPQSLLPAELKNINESGIVRLINGERTTKNII